MSSSGREDNRESTNSPNIAPEPQQETERKANSAQCSICFEDEFPICSMPCCSREGSSMVFCRRCLELLCHHSPVGNVGRCPTCRAYFLIMNGVVQNCTLQGQCRMCRQQKIIIDRGMCDACLLGSQYAFRYECNRCHRHQRIPHPMWRYQPSPAEFGSATWACHLGCGSYTHWRIDSEQVDLIPNQEVPESWGRREDWLAIQVVREMQNGERYTHWRIELTAVAQHHGRDVLTVSFNSKQITCPMVLSFFIFDHPGPFRTTGIFHQQRTLAESVETENEVAID
mmetsp:Transcript_25254/g.42280  ORF Transcript_25254/g.42280 Transcript_25254/m.42280 type:complete len:284 (-) Transcript_25254:102-953(-)